MKKVAIFTEGQGELIFVRQLLIQTVGYNDLSFECIELHSDSFHDVPYRYSSNDPIVHYQIVDVGNDERVMSIIAERQERLVRMGYEIVGLRDMYSAAYKKRSNHIDHNVTNSFIESAQNTIQKMVNADKIHFFFEIMEFESWLLSMYNLFGKMNPILTCDYIRENLGFDLRTINPETQLFHPAVEFGDILRLIGEEYTKSFGQMESILSHLNTEDLNNAIENRRCNSFAIFFTEIQRELREAQNV